MTNDDRCQHRAPNSRRRCSRVAHHDSIYCPFHATHAASLPPTRQFQYGQTLQVEEWTASTTVQIQSLEPEIALLRVLIRDHQQDPALVRRLIGTLVAAIQAQKRLTHDQAQDLAAQVTRFLAEMQATTEPDN